MEWLSSLSEEQLQWGYILITLVLMGLLLYLGRNRIADDSDQLINILDWFEMRGLGTIFHILVLLGALGMAWIGWRLPAEIESFATGDRSILALAFPMTDNVLARLAQIVGAVAYATIACRSMRYIVPVMAFIIIAILSVMAYQYLTFAI